MRALHIVCISIHSHCYVALNVEVVCDVVKFCFFSYTDGHLFLCSPFTCKCYNFVINCDLIRFTTKCWYLVKGNLLDIRSSEISREWGPDVIANGNNLVLCQQIIINSDRDKLLCVRNKKWWIKRCSKLEIQDKNGFHSLVEREYCCFTYITFMVS